MYVIVHNAVAYGPFESRQAANAWVAGSSIANDPYSIYPLGTLPGSTTGIVKLV